MIASLASILISMVLIGLAKAYDFNLNSCSANTTQQSPINLNSLNSTYFDEKYFRYLTNNYINPTTANNWTYFTEEKAVGIAPTAAQGDFGSFLLVKDWAMYSFRLTKILFRTHSEHSINGNFFDVEMQLVHTLDANYYPPGKRISLGLNYLVISIFFNSTSDTNPAKSLLFQFMNLTQFATTSQNPTMARNIKLFQIVQHQPSYLYQGTLTYPECQPALWMVFSNYHLIGATDLSNLVSVIKKNFSDGTTTNYNTRDIFSNSFNGLPTNVYRNWQETSKMISRPTLLSYGSAKHITTGIYIIGLIILSIIF